MKKLLLIAFVVLPGLLLAQQLPQYTYFTYNYMNYNPAVPVAPLASKPRWDTACSGPISMVLPEPTL